MNIKELNKIDFASCVLELRSQLNMSQTELANMLGVSLNSVNRWEQEHFLPTKLVKIKLLKLFDKYGIKYDA